MKIFLTTPPGTTTEKWPPLGLLYIARVLKETRGNDVHIIDAFCENMTSEQFVARIVKERPNVLGMNCTTHTFMDSIEALRKIRALMPEVVIVMGGYHATFASDRILREYPFIDYIIKGEAELAFPELLRCIEGKKAPSSVPSISYMDEGRLIDNKMELIRDLNALPFPDRSMLSEVEYGYTFQGVNLTPGKLTSIVTSRGCPYRCRYCSCSSFSLGEWRPRSPENVADELEMLYSDGYDCVTFVDDNFTQNVKRVEKICALIKAKKIKMKYFFEGRVENASYELLKTMKGAGFEVVYFGIESATDHVLDYYHKTISPERAKRSVENAKKANMLVFTSYIFGAPVESKDDIRNTIEYIKSVKPHGVQINILDCLVGTPIWNEFMTGEGAPKDAWKTNHRIYDCNRDGLSKEELEKLVDEGYAAYLDGWKNMRGVMQLLRLTLKNKTMMKFAVKNIANPKARSVVLNGIISDRDKLPVERAGKK